MKAFNLKTLHALPVGLAFVLCAAPAQAATVIAAYDSRADTSLSDPLSNATTSDLGVGLVASGRSFRTYLTFNLSGETESTGTITLDLFPAGVENNTSAVPQTFSLFVLAADWDGVNQPGPDGTVVATVGFTPQNGGNDGRGISFTSAALTTAFNNALGGNLYLGIKSNLEGQNNRSFLFLASVEDGTLLAPKLTYTAIPEPGVGGLALVGLAALCMRRRGR